MDSLKKILAIIATVILIGVGVTVLAYLIGFVLSLVIAVLGVFVVIAVIAGIVESFKKKDGKETVKKSNTKNAKKENVIDVESKEEK